MAAALRAVRVGVVPAMQVSRWPAIP